MSRRRQLAAIRFDVAGAIDDLRRLVIRAEALACATERQLEQFTWPRHDDEEDEGNGDDRGVWMEHLAHLLGATKESVQAAAYACGVVAAELAKREARS